MRTTELYLDTARLGRMSPSARRAHLDFVQLAGDEGASLFFECFLREGTDGWTSQVRQRYPGLLAWRGLAAFKESLRQLAGTDSGLPLLLAARSSQLVKFAARLLFHPCRNVLVTDLCWPPYRDALAAEAHRANRRLTLVAIREDVMERHATADEIARRVVEEAVAAGCDGAFISSVGHLGFRLPVETIARGLSERSTQRVVLVDGAQEFCHAGPKLAGEHCDLYLASSHKWLGAHNPLSLGFYGRRRSVPVIESLLLHLVGSGEIDDPLLRFTGQLESDALDGVTETVNLTTLFSCQGAVYDALADSLPPAGRLPRRLENLQAAAHAAGSAGWSPLLADPTLQSGILLLQAERDETRSTPSARLRQSFGNEGIALTTYEGGLIRMSMPESLWPPGNLDYLTSALRRIA